MSSPRLYTEAQEDEFKQETTDIGFDQSLYETPGFSHETEYLETGYSRPYYSPYNSIYIMIGPTIYFIINEIFKFFVYDKNKNIQNKIKQSAILLACIIFSLAISATLYHAKIVKNYYRLKTTSLIILLISFISVSMIAINSGAEYTKRYFYFDIFTMVFYYITEIFIGVWI